MLQNKKFLNGNKANWKNTKFHPNELMYKRNSLIDSIESTQSHPLVLYMHKICMVCTGKCHHKRSVHSRSCIPS